MKKLCLFFLFGISDLNAFTFLANADLHVGAEESTQHKIKMQQRGEMISQVKGGDVRGTLLAGDLTNDGTHEQTTVLKKEWVDLFDSMGTFAYLCHGNHDAKGQVFGQMTPPMVYTTERHGNIHYSFDIDGLHFVCCGVYPLDNEPEVGWNPKTLLWLKQDLARVGTVQPTVIFFHYNVVGADSDWWDYGEKDIFFDAIKDYNIKLIITGHQHESFAHVWRNKIPMISVCGDYFASCEYKPLDQSLCVGFYDGNGGKASWDDLLRQHYEEVI